MKTIHLLAVAAGLLACSPEIDTLSENVTGRREESSGRREESSDRREESSGRREESAGARNSDHGDARVGTPSRDILPSLRSIPVPQPPGLEHYVRDRAATIVLGKALFWETGVGSDGMACASCHFHAGADGRLVNQLNPGAGGRDSTFGRMKSGELSGPNYTLTSRDFPFHALEDPDDPRSRVVFDANEVVSSAGVFRRDFLALTDGVEQCRLAPDLFNVGGVNVRRVEPRNAPTVINAVYNFRNFWDGRANNHFNGVDPFGPHSPNARVVAFKEGTCRLEKMDLPASSLASQAVGPPPSGFEMSCKGRKFYDIGRKLLSRRALASQRVAPDDSVLGPHRAPDGRGLTETYAVLIKRAFTDTYASDRCDENGYSQLERNFSLFFGLAIQLYESTLVSDASPYDDYVGSARRAPNPTALSPIQKLGLEVFLGKAACATCHNGALFSNAASLETTGLVRRLALPLGRAAVHDVGFFNIGVRPTAEDLGVGGRDAFGGPLSFSHQAVVAAQGKEVFDDLRAVDACSFEVSPCDPVRSGEREAVSGAFKVPTLRNVELTGPYFHNGGQATLEQVVAFYNRGGDFQNEDMHPSIRPLGLTEHEKEALVEFMRALTDDRVRCEAAPFDHPELRVPYGHPGDTNHVADRDGDGQADDLVLVRTAVGKGGLQAVGQPCLLPFHERLTPYAD